MADTVYEYPNDKPQRGYLGFTCFWKHGEDWVQITLISEEKTDPKIHTFASMPYSKFKEAFKSIAESVKDTKDAFWHDPAFNESQPTSEGKT